LQYSQNSNGVEDMLYCHSYWETHILRA
jgi:hypothetical protein